MTRKQFIKKLEVMADELLTEVSAEELTDKAREHANNFIWSAIDCLEANDDER